jgi:hypothetical protein
MLTTPEFTLMDPQSRTPRHAKAPSSFASRPPLVLSTLSLKPFAAHPRLLPLANCPRGLDLARVGRIQAIYRIALVLFVRLLYPFVLDVVLSIPGFLFPL